MRHFVWRIAIFSSLARLTSLCDEFFIMNCLKGKWFVPKLVNSVFGTTRCSFRESDGTIVTSAESTETSACGVSAGRRTPACQECGVSAGRRTPACQECGVSANAGVGSLAKARKETTKQKEALLKQNSFDNFRNDGKRCKRAISEANASDSSRKLRTYELRVIQP
ncbi:hypothetical protein L596_000062 [Steinernema carpocapsae]|uniref:Uncharacterized protein n=1 Tax=Steinernema carpocapsae TaxID=34508 RepID=A0A4U8UHI5_STECR|nr:hypothetical protein L596_000062 [Steinernema carpocapsae]